MRTQEQIDFIKSTHSNPVQLHNVLDEAQIETLLTAYHTSSKIEKNTGPKVVYVNEGDGLIDNVLSYLRDTFGNFKLRSAHFFETDVPHVLHIDDGKDLPNAFKAFTIPLHTEGKVPSDNAKLIMYDQYYYGGPVKFFAGEETIDEVYYNTPLFDYKDVDGLNKKGIPNIFKERLIPHIKEEWLEGLSVNCYFPWTIGSIIAFDSLRIHSASDFRRVGIKKKIGLSIFTELENGR